MFVVGVLAWFGLGRGKPTLNDRLQKEREGGDQDEDRHKKLEDAFRRGEEQDGADHRSSEGEWEQPADSGVLSVEFVSVASDAADITGHKRHGVGDVGSDRAKAGRNKCRKGEKSPTSGNSIDAAGKKCRDGEEDDAAGAQIVHGS